MSICPDGLVKLMVLLVDWLWLLAQFRQDSTIHLCLHQVCFAVHRYLADLQVCLHLGVLTESPPFDSVVEGQVNYRESRMVDGYLSRALPMFMSCVQGGRRRMDARDGWIEEKRGVSEHGLCMRRCPIGCRVAGLC